MCYEWLYWRYATDKINKHEEQKPVTERAPAATRPVEPMPAPQAKKPEKVEPELETA